MDVLIAKTNSDIAHYIVKEFIHSLSLEDCVRDYGGLPDMILTHPHFRATSRVYRLACAYRHYPLAQLIALHP